MQTRITALVAVLIALSLAACGTTKSEKKKADVQKAAQVGLVEISDEINAGVQRAATRIMNETDDADVKRLMITWQIRTMEYTRRMLRLPDLRWAYLDMLTMLYRTRMYLDAGEGRKILGPQRPIAVEELDLLLSMMDARGKSVIDEKQLKEIQDYARNWAERNPIEGEAVEYPSRLGPAGSEPNVIKAIAGLPGDIFSIGGGVKDTAQAVDNVSDAANRAVNVVESLPTSVRWQTELLLLKVQEDKVVQKLMADIGDVSGAITKIGATVDDLPNRVQRILTGTVRDLEASQPELRQTVSEVRGTVEGVEQVFVKADETLAHVDQTGVWVDRSLANMNEAGKAWEGAFGQLNMVVNPPKDPNEPPRTEPAPPFDMKDVATSAEWLTKAGIELRGTVEEVRAVIEGDGIDQRLKQVDQTTEATLAKATLSVSELMDRLTLRGVVLILVFFGAMLGYRVVASRIPKRE